MCVKKKEDSQFYKSGINIEYIQNNVRKSLVREYTYLRKLKGLTQAEVAERAGISRTNISRFESGEYNPTLEMLVKLATAMDLDILVTLKPKNNNGTGEIIEMEAPIHVSNVMLSDPKTKKPTKVKIEKDSKGKKIRISKKSNEKID